MSKPIQFPRSGRARRLTRWSPAICAVGIPLACLLGAVGCESDHGPTSRPGDAVLKDPMGYKMNDFPTVSGDHIGDHKGLKRDWDAFINP